MQSYCSTIRGLALTLPLFRNGMINVSPVGRNASIQERNDYEKYDKEHGIRTKFVAALKEKFPDFGLTYAHTPPLASNTANLVLA